MAGYVCPECGTPPSPDGGPGPACACAARARRAAEAAAEMAAAEDFDPLRIRPYVNLEATGGAADADEPVPPADLPEGRDPATTAMPAVAPMPAAPDAGAGYVAGAGAGSGYVAGAGAGAGYVAGAGAGSGYAAAPGTGEGLGYAAGTSTGAGSGYAAAPGGGPQAYAEGDASETMPLLLDRAAFGAPPAADLEPEPRGRRRGVAVALVAALAVAGTAAFAVGVLSSDDGGELAGPNAPSGTSTALLVSEAPTPSASETDPDEESASPSASESESPSASPSASRTRTAPAAPTASPRRSASASAPSPTASQPKPPTAPENGGPTLSRGDTGPEVLELQRRLKEIWAYKGPENGEYNGKVEEGVASFQSYMDIDEDPWGVYGPATREALEAVTSG